MSRASGRVLGNIDELEQPYKQSNTPSLQEMGALMCFDVLCVSSCHYSIYLGPTNQIVLCQDHCGTIRISNWLQMDYAKCPPKNLKIAILGIAILHLFRIVTRWLFTFCQVQLIYPIPLGRFKVTPGSATILRTQCAFPSHRCEDFRTSLGNGVALLWRHLGKNDMKKIPWLQWPKLFGGFWPDSPRFQSVASLLVKYRHQDRTQPATA